MINKNHFNQIKAGASQYDQDEMIGWVHEGTNAQISSNFYNGE